MSDFINRVRNVASGKPGSGDIEAGLPLEPKVPPLNFEAPVPQVSPPQPSPSITAAAPVSADGAPDLLGFGPALRQLAGLISHAGTRAPIAIGLVGQAGAGKSFALNALLKDIAAHAAGATRQAGSPYISQMLIARVDAAAAGEPATRIGAALFDVLQRPGPDGRAYPALAEEASEAIIDPVEAARIARERLSDARRRLDTEREALQDMNSRRTRLADSVLYEASGSRIDAHARTNRSKIESRLRSFGFTSGDPVATYKDLVRDVAENGGISGRVRACLRALWGFRGQTRLIVLALLFFAAAWGIGEAQATRETWLGWLRGYDALKPATAWIEAHIGWLATARQTAVWVGVLALLWNLFRAARFIMPIFRGVSLFKSDIETRNNDLDTLIANQTRRVNDLANEIDPLSKRSADAERRAAMHAGNQQSSAKSPFADGSSFQATAFIGALAKASAANNGAAPRRIVVAFDNLDALSTSAATNFMAHVQELLDDPAYVTVITASDAGLTRFVDIPLQLSALFNSQRLGGLVQSMLGGKPAMQAAMPVLDATRSPLDAPLHGAESSLLEALAPFAARGPRDVRRFVNIYRLARSDTTNSAALALALALQAGTSDTENAALAQALDQARDGETLHVDGAPRIAAALHAARAASGSTITAGDLRTARALATQWSF